MIEGERIYSNITRQTYMVRHAFKAGGQSEVCFATTDKSSKVFLLKRFICIKYTETNETLKERCLAFENERRSIYADINKYTLPGATCSFVYDFFREKSFYYVVTERIDGIELQPEVLYKTLSLKDRLFLFSNIVYAYFPFERSAIVHADIKPENILLEKNGDLITPRIIDFESAFHTNNIPPKGEIIGTDQYYSPELANYNSEDNEEDIIVDHKSDIFSLGIILYQLVEGHYPVNKEEAYVYEAERKRKTITYSKDCPKKLQTLIKTMLSYDPSIRPSIMEVIYQLKNIEENTHTRIEPCCPLIKKTIVSDTRARLKLFNFAKKSELFFKTDERNEYQPYNEHIGVIIEDDDVQLQMKIRDEKGSEFLFEKTVSVSSSKGSPCKKPLISIESNVVTLTTEEKGVSIFYTTDGETPTKKSKLYSSPFFVEDGIIIKTIATKIGKKSSEVAKMNSSSKIKMK